MRLILNPRVLLCLKLGERLLLEPIPTRAVRRVTVGIIRGFVKFFGEPGDLSQGLLLGLLVVLVY